MTYTDEIYENPKNLLTKKSGFIESKIINKPWGSEELVVYTERYVLKFLNVNAGELLSVQYHKEKMETLRVVEGKGTILLGKDKDSVEELPFEVGMTVQIMPGTVHTFKAETNMKLLEASTPEIWDVVRISDKYDRKEKRE